MARLLVQTGSVPALLYALRHYAAEGPLRLLAVDSENVRQYLRDLGGIETRYFANLGEAESVLHEWSDSPVVYLGGSAFPRLRRKVRRMFPTAEPFFPERTDDWAAFQDEFNSNIRRDSVLLVQSEESDFIEEYLNDVFPKHGFARPSMCMVCRQQDLGVWRQLHPHWRFWTYRAPSELVDLAFQLRRQRFDASIVFFTGNRTFAKVKALPLVCGARQKIVVNQYQQFIEASPVSLLRFGYQRWRYGVVPKWADSTRVLLVQSADETHMEAVAQRLQESGVFRKPRYWLLARTDLAPRLANLLPVADVLTWPAHVSVAEYWRILRTVRRQQFDAAVLAFTGDSAHTGLKWLPFLAAIKHKLIFNRHYDCFFFTLRKFVDYWMGRHVGQISDMGVNRVLVVQTWDEEHMRALLQRLQEVRPFYRPRYSLFTREDKVGAFAAVYPFHEILTYPVGVGIGEYWKCLKKVRKRRFDGAVVAFTEEPTYQKLKWLPFLSAIRQKLIFNRHLDCFWFSAGSLLNYHLQRLSGGVQGARSSLVQLAGPLLFPLVRALLFPFRFLYLLLAVTWAKLRRAYHLRNGSAAS